MNQKFLPACMVALSVLSAVVYGVKGDARHCLYWVGSAILISAVTF